LVIVICGSATDDRASKGFAGLAIGFTVMLCGLFAGPLTGNSLNPARSLAPALFSGHTGSVLPYVIGPLLGGIVAVQVYRIMRAPHEGPNAVSLETNPGTSRLSTETVSK
jgi:glycerol uptake facilitator-like aquaporin